MFPEVATPAVLLDRPRLERNLSAAQARATGAAVQLRPHVKTHRSVEIAQRQLAAGASGITCAKPSEAQVFVDAGFEDVRVAYPVAGAHHLDRLIDLSRRARISFCVDSIESARLVSVAFCDAGLRAQVLTKIDCGYGRAGWRWDDAELADAARALRDLQGLQVVGVLTHAGQAYQPGDAGVSTAETLMQHAIDERDRTEQAATLVGDVLGSGPDSLEVSVGSTPTFWSFEPGSEMPGQRPAQRVTELRPGNYVFHDLTQVDLGACDLDHCALSVLATVVSVRRRGGSPGRIHALIDAGKKTFTSDQRVAQQGFGLVLDQQSWEQTGRLAGRSDWRLHTLSEEHGWLDLPADADLRVGDRVRVVMNHACVVASTQAQLVETNGHQVVGMIELSARGCSV